jgi:hypothetical protein
MTPGDGPRPVMSARARMVAMVAGSIAGGYAANVETSGESPARVARWAVELAAHIVGLCEENDREDTP